MTRACILKWMKPALLLVTAAALHAQTAPDPADTLSRARLKISATLRRLPKYTCVQTIDRSYFTRVSATEIPRPPGSLPSRQIELPAATSCEQIGADKKKGRTSPRLDITDRVRVNVAEGDGLEIHSWPAASRFETGDIDELINRGPSSTGSFGGYLVDIFDNDGAQFDFIGDKTNSGRHILTYGYRVAEEMSHYKIRTAEGWGITAYDGTFDIDADSLDLLRISVDTPELPPETGLCEARSSLEYSRVSIGGGDFLLPRQSQLHLVHPGTLETTSTSIFTGCRQYQSTPTSIPDASGANNATPREPLPLEIELFLSMDAPIDSDAAAAGDPVTATLLHDVTDPKSPIRVLIPAGAVAHGRISRMEHWLASGRAHAESPLKWPTFIFGISWQFIDIRGASVPLAARIEPWRGATVSAPAPGKPPDAFVIETEAKRHIVKNGYVNKWVTMEVK
jgi:hypothetical protein